jgi:AcrR family transcriptional regulator
MTQRPGLRAKKNLAVKQALFDAAIVLFAEQGFDKTSVDEIAAKAGFSRATFFNHFGTKHGVLRFYGQRLQTRVEELFERANPEASPLDRIHDLLLAMARYADEHCEELKLIYMYSQSDPEYLTKPTPARMRVFEIIQQLVIEAQQAGQVRRDVSPKVLAFHINSIYQNAVTASLGGYSDAEPAVEAGWLFVLDGVRGGR